MKKINRKETFDNFMLFELINFQFVYVTPSNFAFLIAKTVSSGPIVSVPTTGSWKYDDLMFKIPKTLRGGVFVLPSVYPTFPWYLFRLVF